MAKIVSVVEMDEGFYCIELVDDNYRILQVTYHPSGIYYIYVDKLHVTDPEERKRRDDYYKTYFQKKQII